MNRIGELLLTVLFQTTILYNGWGLFYLLFFAHFLQCFVQTSRYNMVEYIFPDGVQDIYFNNPKLPWQNIPDSVVNPLQPPDAATTTKNKKVKILWGTTMAFSLLILIGAIVFSHMKLGLNTSEFLLKNAIIISLIGALEALFFYFVGWFDFPVSQAKGAADYLQEVLNNIQNK
jgi:hypothetical protein